MPDLLAHVLVVYAAATALTWSRLRLSRRMVPVAMVGAALPDLVKAYLVLDSGTVEAALGLPFSWQPLHRLGGLLVLAGLGALLFDRRFRRPAFGTLLAGGVSHLVLDALIRRANGLAPPYLYPFTWWAPPSGDLYLSSDAWPAAAAVVVAAAVLAYDRYRRR